MNYVVCYRDNRKHNYDKKFSKKADAINYIKQDVNHVKQELKTQNIKYKIFVNSISVTIETISEHHTTIPSVYEYELMNDDDYILNCSLKYNKSIGGDFVGISPTQL